MALLLKTVTVGGKTYAEIEGEGTAAKPVYLDDADNNKAVAVDGNALQSRIVALSGEARGHRIAKEDLETKLKTFEGIEDPVAALEAIEKLKSIDEGQLIAAGKVEEIKAAATTSANAAVAAAEKKASKKIEDLTSELGTTREQLHTQMVGTAFANSKFVKEKVAVPVDLMQSQFGKHFKVVDGKIQVFQTDGKTPVYSRKTHGEPVDNFDEGLEILVDGYAFKDAILKGTGGGSGALGGNGGGRKEDLSKLPPIERMKAARGMAYNKDAK